MCNQEALEGLTGVSTPNNLICLFRDLHTDMAVLVWVRTKTSLLFMITSSTIQGCVLALSLSYMVINVVIDQCFNHLGIPLDDLVFLDFVSANDFDLFNDDLLKLAVTLEPFEKAACVMCL